MGDQDHKLKEINTVQPPWPSFDLSPLAKKKFDLTPKIQMSHDICVDWF